MLTNQKRPAILKKERGRFFLWGDVPFAFFGKKLGLKEGVNAYE